MRSRVSVWSAEVMLWFASEVPSTHARPGTLGDRDDHQRTGGAERGHEPFTFFDIADRALPRLPGVASLDRLVLARKLG